MSSPLISVSREDAAVLHAAGQKGRQTLRWPEDRAWVESVLERSGDRMTPEDRIAGMRRRGSLATIGRQRWLIMPPGASTIEQAAPLKALLAAKYDGRVEWYLGYLSALADHRLTDIDPEDVYIGYRGYALSARERIGSRVIRAVRHTRRDDWQGVERERVGRGFSYRSDVERTLLDCFDQPRRGGPPEVWVRAWERAMREQRADPGRLTDYAEHRSDVVQARLAFWLHESGHVREARRIVRGLGGPLRGTRLLDASRAFGDGPWQRDSATGLQVNIPPDTIDGWMAYGK